MKFLPAPKHAFDIKQQKESAKKINALLNGTIIDANGNVIGKILYTEGNTVFQINAASGGGSVKMFKITQVFAEDLHDYFIAREWDGTTLGSTDIPIAKHPDQRPSITSRNIIGVTFTYVYDNDNFRTTTVGGDPAAVQNEQCVMPYEVDGPDGIDDAPIVGIIFASKSENGTGVMADGSPVEWIDLTPRQWGRY